jgi:hypothetical protein
VPQKNHNIDASRRKAPPQRSASPTPPAAGPLPLRVSGPPPLHAKFAMTGLPVRRAAAAGPKVGRQGRPYDTARQPRRPPGPRGGGRTGRPPQTRAPAAGSTPSQPRAPLSFYTNEVFNILTTNFPALPNGRTWGVEPRERGRGGQAPARAIWGSGGGAVGGRGAGEARESRAEPQGARPTT